MTILLQRLCWNTNGWRGPTGDMYGKEDSYVGQYGFGHEEWNLNTSDLLDGDVFGYSYYNPPNGSELAGRTHDIYFFAVSPTRERKLVGYYEAARFLDENARKRLRAKFSKSDLFEKRLEELLSLELPSIRAAEQARDLLLGEFSSNIIVSPSNVHSFEPAPLLTSEMLGGREPKYFNRYTTPVFLEAGPAITRHPTIPANKTPGNNQDLLEDSYLRFTEAQRKVITRLHNQLSNRFRAWLKTNGVQAIQRETNCVDVECFYNEKHFLFELKTCFQQSTRHAIRDAIGQILEYSHFPGRKTPNFAAIVLDHAPKEDEILWFKTLAANRLPIELFWLKGEDVFSANVASHPLSSLAATTA